MAPIFTCHSLTTSPPLLKPPFLLFFNNPKFHTIPNPNSSLTLTPKRHSRCLLITANSSASTSEIELVRNRQGVYTSKKNKVVVLWDLDNKPPRGPPYPAAVALKTLAQKFGDIIEISAYANRHAFTHLPDWVLEQRRERKQMDILERKGLATAAEPYICGVCGRKCKTNLELKKHFKQLHERERQKKLNRMRQLKGKKRQRYKERFVSGNHKYNAEERRLLTPKVGYGLAQELRRAGVYVKTVEDKPQAADRALKRQIEHSMSRGVDWLVLISDDSDFSDTLKRAREANLRTLVIGDRDRALGRHADLWVPWIGVENGAIIEKDLKLKRRDENEDFEDDGVDDGFFSVSHFDGGMEGDDMNSMIDELAGLRIASGLNSVSVSVFSEGEDEDEDEEEEGDYLVWDSEDEQIEDEDGGFYIY